MNKTFIAGLAGALVALIVVAGFMVLDRTTLHWYSEGDAPVPAVSALQSNASPRPTTTGRGSATPTLSTTDPNDDRSDCDDMRGTPYRSPTERTWFLANCVTREPLRPFGTWRVGERLYPVYRSYDDGSGRVLPIPGRGGTTCNEIGTFTYCSGDVDTTCQKIGSFTYCSGDVDTTCQRIGSFTYCD